MCPGRNLAALLGGTGPLQFGSPPRWIPTLVAVVAALLNALDVVPDLAPHVDGCPARLRGRQHDDYGLQTSD
jgi:hypothetical protein